MAELVVIAKPGDLAAAINQAEHIEMARNFASGNISRVKRQERHSVDAEVLCEAGAVSTQSKQLDPVIRLPCRGHHHSLLNSNIRPPSVL